MLLGHCVLLRKCNPGLAYALWYTLHNKDGLMHIAIWKQKSDDKEHLSMVTFKDRKDLRDRLFSGELPDLPDNIIVTNSDGLVIREYVITLEEVDIP